MKRAAKQVLICTFGRDGGNWYGKHFSTGRL